MHRVSWLSSPIYTVGFSVGDTNLGILIRALCEGTANYRLRLEQHSLDRFTGEEMVRCLEILERHQTRGASTNDCYTHIDSRWLKQKYTESCPFRD